MSFPIEELGTFWKDGSAQAYMAVVSTAICLSFARYFKFQKHSTTPLSLLPPLISLCVLGITWFYIFRFIATHIHTSESYFGDAYRDVLKDEGQYMISVQLLTWAIVSVLWMEDEGIVSDLVFIGYGFLGAMGASFVLWVPSLYWRMDRSRLARNHSVSLLSAISAVIGFVCIVNIAPCSEDELSECVQNDRFGAFRPSYDRWLHGLHYVLLVPAFGKVLPLPLSGIQVDAAIVYFAASIVFGLWHFSLLASSKQTGISFVMATSMTDCQISITTDMVCSCLITVFAIYRDTLLYAQAGWMGENKRSDNVAKDAAILQASLAALGVALFSPGAVLAFHLGRRCSYDMHMRVVARGQQWVANKLRSETLSPKENKVLQESGAPTWCNLGLWTDQKGNQVSLYDEACEGLAMFLGHAAALGENDGVLCCGCGSGPELDLFKDRFKVQHITGIDPGMDRIKDWENNRLLKGGDYNIRRMTATVEDLRSRPSQQLFGSKLFNKIVALDNVYHYRSKFNFFQDCKTLLAPGGIVAVSDLLIRTDAVPQWVRLMLLVCGLQGHNLWTEKEYKQQLSDLGFTDISVQSTEGNVLIGWEKFFPKGVLQYLDYSIVVASTPKADPNSVRKTKKVAVVGSGLAGLATAHSLIMSSEDIEVTVYEAHDRPGLAGNSTWYEGHLVDIPPRMASKGYYKEYRKLLSHLNIPTQVVEADCTYYGTDAKSGRNKNFASYDISSTRNNLEFALFEGGLSNFWTVGSAMSSIKLGECNDDDDTSPVLTFGDWLKSTKLCCSSTTDSFEMCQKNPFLYLVIGSLGWMLSCTYQQLMDYPAGIILPYLHSLYKQSMQTTGDGSVVRVNPSVKLMEQTLLYGVKELKCGNPVSGLDGKKTIDGIRYDAVICATEARAIPKVFKNAPKAFSEVQYHPSIIYLHTDESFMPPNKKDWRKWTVEMKKEFDEPQLSFWLNEVYPDSNFSGNVFQTWAPLHDPKPESILKKASFQRVVHTKETPRLLKEIAAAQGKDGIYYAGSYTEYGMGLLEQALISGRKAAQRVLDEVVVSED
ncbi:MAG: hypothetical protein SGBAC_002677 [Bacillariaceae sp.]